MGAIVDTGYERISSTLKFSIAMLAALPLPHIGMKSD